MTKKEHDDFMKLIKANNLLANDGLKAAKDLSKIIKAFAEKVTPQKQPVKRKAEVSLRVLLEIQSYDKHLN